jgi:hypothetical protein
MTDINNLFFDLIRVAIGNQVCLSRTPSAVEWGDLYAMAKKQSLVGVCFAGVQKLQMQQQCPPEMLYLQWMGMAAKIQQRNEVVNRQCVEVQTRLSACRLRSCVLKGQGVATLYRIKDESLKLRDLSALRQSGDIDVWVDGTIDSAIQTLRAAGIEVKNVNIKHAEAKFFEDTEVEIHFVPSWFYNLVTQKKFTRWVEENKAFEKLKLQAVGSTGSPTKSLELRNEGLEILVPTLEFNLVYSLIHLFRHTLDEGVGLRQLMDYYFILQALETEADHVKKFNMMANAKSAIADLGLTEFAGGVVWVLNQVFGKQDVQVWEVNERYGSFLLNEMMRGGNFGAYNENKRGFSENAFVRGSRNLWRIVRFVDLFPGEVLCTPVWKTWHWWWRKHHFKDCK